MIQCTKCGEIISTRWTFFDKKAVCSKCADQSRAIELHERTNSDNQELLERKRQLQEKNLADRVARRRHELEVQEKKRQCALELQGAAREAAREAREQNRRDAREAREAAREARQAAKEAKEAAREIRKAAREAAREIREAEKEAREARKEATEAEIRLEYEKQETIRVKNIHIELLIRLMETQMQLEEKGLGPIIPELLQHHNLYQRPDDVF